MPTGPDPVLQALGERVAAQTTQSLRFGKTEKGVSDLVRKIDLFTDGQIDAFTKRDKPDLDCKAGCNHCCYRVVQCTTSEAVHAAQAVAGFSEEARQALKERLYEYEREVAPHFGFGLETLRPRCPLLVDGLCSIYESRPLSCRGRNSEDVAACAQDRAEPVSVGIPSYEKQDGAAEMAEAGLNYGLGESALLSGPLDFARALKIALSQPEVIDDWLRGGLGFYPAIAKTTQVETAPPNKKANHRRYGPTEEPTGQFDLTGLMLAEYLASSVGDNRAAIEAAQGSHPGYAMFRARVPFTYSSEAEVWEWRGYYETALRELLNADLDPKQAFDGMVAFRPHEIIYQQYNNRDLLALAGDLLCNKIAARALPELTKPIEQKKRSGKIRVGYISNNLRHSSNAPWALGWLKRHTDDFETFAIHLGDRVDPVTNEFKAAADHFLHLPRRAPVPSDARTIKGLDLDILIYLEVGTNMRSGQLAALRLAPIQCTCWGGPECSGMPTIDYYISSELMESPEGDEHYTEKLVRLPGSGVCFEKQELPISTLEKRDFGTGDGPLIVSLQHAPKFAPRWDDLYRRINVETGSPIVFIDKPRVGAPVFKERLAKAGVQAHFLSYLGVYDYLALIKNADVILDTPGWNGGITTIHALQYGAPVVTLPTELRRGRQSFCFLKVTGAPGLIAKDEDDYIDLAINEDRRREAMKNFNPEAMFDDPQSVVALEEFIRSVVTE